MRKETLALAFIFLVVLTARLYFAFSVPYFSYDAYFNLKQAEHISNTGLPLYDDPLSYSGRTLIFSPLFHYILAFFNLFIPITLVGKIIPNLFASSLVIIIYLIAKEITKSSSAALFSATISGFIPVFFSQTINSVSYFTLLLPLIFYAIYCILKIGENKKYVYYFIISIFLMPLIHQTAALFIIGLVIYFILVRVENLRQSKSEVELILFSVFVVLWIMFLLFKNALLVHGIAFIWQNIPKELLGLYFKEVNILEAIYMIGLVPFILGIYVVYNYIFREKMKATYLLFGLGLATAALLWLKLIPFNFGLMLLGVLLAVLFAQSYKDLFIYIEKTKVSKLHKLFFLLLVLTFTSTSVIPSFSYSLEELKESPTGEEIKALLWLKENTLNESIILASLSEGHLINYFAERRNFIDTNFLLVENIDPRFKDFNTLFTTDYQTDAIGLLNKYEIDYLYISKNAKKEFNLDKIGYLEYGKCFDELYDDGVLIYESLCKLEEE